MGIDSIWKVSENAMQYTNSLKMKIAVILGVVHMIFGLFIRLLNNFKKKKYSEMFTLTIPQIIFLLCTFVYMDYLIVYKWLSSYPNSASAPSIISTMIQVYVGIGSAGKDITFYDGERSL
jgi:V-type H+-transporting ATPase subunit a